MVIYSHTKKLESTLIQREELDAKRWKRVKIHSTLVAPPPLPLSPVYKGGGWY